MDRKFRKEAKPLPQSSEKKCGDECACGGYRTIGALVIRNGQIVEISFEEYRAIGGVLQLNEHGVFGEIILDLSHAH